MQVVFECMCVCVCAAQQQRSCLAPSLQKAPAAPNESRQVFGRVTINLTADRFKMDPSQKCASASASAAAAAAAHVWS